MYFMMSCFFGSALYFTMYNMGSDSYYATVSNLLSAAQVINHVHNTVYHEESQQEESLH